MSLLPAKKITANEELSRIFNVLMIALRWILKRKGSYLNEKSIGEKREKADRRNHAVHKGQSIDDYFPCRVKKYKLTCDELVESFCRLS